MSKRLTIRDLINEVAERNRTSQRLQEAGAPRAGIFWFIQESGQLPSILADYAFIQRGKADGIYIKCWSNHVNFWRSLKRMAYQQTTGYLIDTAAEDWPRGRVVFNTVEKQFEVFLDNELETPQFEAEIVAYFHLPADETSFAVDPRYVAARFTFGSGGPLTSAEQMFWGEFDAPCLAFSAARRVVRPTNGVRSWNPL